MVEPLYESGTSESFETPISPVHSARKLSGVSKTTVSRERCEELRLMGAFKNVYVLFACLGYDVREELEYDSTRGGIADTQVQEYS